MSVNEHLTEQLHKLVIKKFERRKVYVRFRGNSWAVDLAEMGSLSSKYKNAKYLLCVIDVFTNVDGQLKKVKQSLKFLLK